jgi:hypothetical protein
LKFNKYNLKEEKMKFLAELQETVNFLTEGEGLNKKHYFNGLFLEFDSPNKNKRIYRSEIHDPVVKEYIKNNVNNDTAWGELDHPDGPILNLKQASHRIVELVKEGKNWVGKAIICNTPNGNIINGLHECGGKLGVSSRGLGSLKASTANEGFMEVQPDYKIITAADVVSNPSAHGAFVQGIMENVEWFYDESTGQWLAEQSTLVKNQIKKLSIKEIEEKKAIMFEQFLLKLQTNK